jgi:hypothetical protein
MTRLENLKAELSAIDRLNQFYWKTKDPDRYERLGYLVRKDRRRELVAELLKLVQQVANSEEPMSRSDQSCRDAAESSSVFREKLVRHG